jgi:hypothetical protein
VTGITYPTGDAVVRSYTARNQLGSVTFNGAEDMDMR